MWLYSNDNGTSWSTLTGFIGPARGRVAIAADPGLRRISRIGPSLASGAMTIDYNKDPNGDGTGLGTSVVVNDTNLFRTPNYPDIVVSPDGKHIIITALRWNQMDSLWVFVSHDSGATWSSKPVISCYDPAVAPPAANPGLMWYTHTLAMGSNGYAILMTAANYDSNAVGTYWELYSETRDYGDTWSTPAWVTPPAASDYAADVNFFEQGHDRGGRQHSALCRRPVEARRAVGNGRVFTKPVAHGSIIRSVIMTMRPHLMIWQTMEAWVWILWAGCIASTRTEQVGPPELLQRTIFKPAVHFRFQ